MNAHAQENVYKSYLKAGTTKMVCEDYSTFSGSIVTIRYFQSPESGKHIVMIDDVPSTRSPRLYPISTVSGRFDTVEAARAEWTRKRRYLRNVAMGEYLRTRTVYRVADED
jgi:hypothetical protein